MLSSLVVRVEFCVARILIVLHNPAMTMGSDWPQSNQMNIGIAVSRDRRPFSSTMSRASASSLGDFAIERLRACSNFCRHGLPATLGGKLARIDCDPGVEPFRDCPERQDLRAQPGRLNLTGKMLGPGSGQIRIAGERGRENGFVDGPRPRRQDRHGITVIALGK